MTRTVPAGSLITQSSIVSSPRVAPNRYGLSEMSPGVPEPAMIGLIVPSTVVDNCHLSGYRLAPRERLDCHPTPIWSFLVSGLGGSAVSQYPPRMPSWRANSSERPNNHNPRLITTTLNKLRMITTVPKGMKKVPGSSIRTVRAELMT